MHEENEHDVYAQRMYHQFGVECVVLCTNTGAVMP